MRSAAVRGVIAFSSSPKSPYGMSLKPGVNGPKSFLYSSEEENEVIVIVLP
jgi:hypothetical protein